MTVLTAAVIVAAVLVLVGGVYIARQVLTVSKAPRTALERNILVLQTVVQQKPTSSSAWGDYIRSLIEARRFGQAEAVLDDARAAVGTATAVQIEEVRLLQARGRERQALDLAGRVVDQAYAEKRAKLGAASSAGIAGGYKFNELADILVLRGDLYSSEGRYKEAIASYTAALQEDPTMADVMTSRGLARERSGDAEGARRDYEAALRLLPDYGPAVEGLQRIGTEAGK